MSDLSAQAIAGYAALAPHFGDAPKVDSATLYAPVIDLLPPPPARVLDVGAGPGHDAVWLSSQGHDVTAVEPVSEFRAAISARLPGSHPLDDRLPELRTVAGRFDLIVVNGVWQHLAPEIRPRAWQRLESLLATSGRLILALRFGPARPQRPVAPTDLQTELDRADAAGLTLLRQADRASHLAENIADGVTWTWLALTRKAPA